MALRKKGMESRSTTPDYFSTPCYHRRRQRFMRAIMLAWTNRENTVSVQAAKPRSEGYRPMHMSLFPRDNERKDQATQYKKVKSDNSVPTQPPRKNTRSSFSDNPMISQR
jgi:hypothetical protein